MGSWFSKPDLRDVDVQQPVPGNALVTLTVLKSFLEGKDTRKFVTQNFQVGGTWWVLCCAKLGDERIVVELHNKNSNPVKVCCVLRIENSNGVMRSVVSSTTCFEDFRHVMKLPVRPQTIADPRLKLITANDYFRLKFNLRVREDDEKKHQRNEHWSFQIIESPSVTGGRSQTYVIEWHFRDLTQFDQCAFDSKPFEINGRTLRLKFCPRGRSGADNKASIFLCSDAGTELQGRLKCSVKNSSEENDLVTINDFSISPLESACMVEIVDSRAFTEEEFGYLHERWLKLLLGIKLPENGESPEPEPSSKKEPKTPSEESFFAKGSSQEEEENEYYCLQCELEGKKERAVAALIHSNKTCKGVCLQHKTMFEGRRKARCPKCGDPVDSIEILQPVAVLEFREA